MQKLRYLAFTGEDDRCAAEAAKYGGIERVVPREQLVETAMQIAGKIAEKSPYLLKLTKESLTGIAADRELEDNYRWEQGFTLQAYLSPDSVEALESLRREARRKDFRGPDP